MREVTLRIKAVMRRFEHETQPPADDILTVGDIVIDKERHNVMSAGAEIDLTSTEFKLPLFLAEKKGVCRVVKSCCRMPGATIMLEIPELWIRM